MTNVMHRAWEIFRKTYDYPKLPFSSIGPQCFAWALRTAWAEARFAERLAAMSDADLASAIAFIQRELDWLEHRGFSVHVENMRSDLKAEARPYIAEQFRRSLVAPSLKIAA